VIGRRVFSREVVFVEVEVLRTSQGNINRSPKRTVVGFPQNDKSTAIARYLETNGWLADFLSWDEALGDGKMGGRSRRRARRGLSRGAACLRLYSLRSTSMAMFRTSADRSPKNLGNLQREFHFFNISLQNADPAL